MIKTKSREILDLVYSTGALKTGKSQDYYFDSKQLMLDPSGALAVGRYVAEKLVSSGATSVGGMALGAIPIVSAVTCVTNRVSGFYVLGGEIFGRLDSDIPTAIVEDTVTTGSSILKAIRIVERRGNSIVKVLCLLDRNEGGREALAEAGYELCSIMELI